MDPIQKLVESLPRWMFVGLALSVALVVIFILNPPHSVCDSQWELFQKEQTPFLFNDPKKKYIKTTVYEKEKERCFNGNNLGSCANLFSGIQNILNHIEGGNPECHENFFKKRQVKTALVDTMRLMLRLAWGNQGPKSSFEKLSWLNSNHVFLFCNLKQNYQSFLGKTSWEKWREEEMASLPNPAKLSREQIWRRSLFSVSCKNI